MSAYLYIEGSQTGPASKAEQGRCREGFRKLIEKAGLAGRMPRLFACGGRASAFDDFQTAHAQRKAGDYIAMLVDSEGPPADIEKTWDHLMQRDGWDKPAEAEDEQVLFMTTCMETWIVADRDALKEHYGHQLQESGLPPLHDLESRDRHDVHERLVHATRHCSNAFSKGNRSFEVVGVLNADALARLPSFARMVRILKEKLQRHGHGHD